MKRLVPFLLVLLGAPAAAFGSSTGAIASARIIRPTATIGLPATATANATLVVSGGSERITLPVTAGQVELALEIGAASSLTVSDTAPAILLVSRTAAPAASRVVSITIHNR